MTSQPKIRYAAGQRLRVLVKGQWCWCTVVQSPAADALDSTHELQVEMAQIEYDIRINLINISSLAGT